MANVLIIGKNGTLGNEFVRLYGTEAIGLDRNDLDITDEAAVKSKIIELKPSVIINCAAYNAVDKAEQDLGTANKINGYAVGYIAKAAREISAIVVHYSTDYVFDGENMQGYNESDAPNPLSEYGRSKLLGETELAKHTDRYYLIRTTALYGQQGLGESSKINYVDRILQLSKEKEVLEAVIDQFRQPTWTLDLARATKKLIGSQAEFGLYHLANSGQASWYAWAKEILKIRHLPNQLKENIASNFASSGHTAPRPKYGILNNTKTDPLRPWQEALTEYLQTIP
jgi:dTDP-4-dehydrorhamnose reductase